MFGRSARAFIGLGSNLQDPVGQICTALDALAALPETRRLTHSALYRSTPMGPRAQPDFINAVAALETRLSASALLSHLQRIERRHGRVRGLVRWGPRTLDLDLLLFGDARFATRVLTIPHPGLHRRPFVLYPLHDIAPNLVIPGRGALAKLLAKVSAEGLQVIPSSGSEGLEAICSAKRTG